MKSSSSAKSCILAVTDKVINILIKCTVQSEEMNKRIKIYNIFADSSNNYCEISTSDLL